ncbi:low molecular weight protein-tyrosine-phosphatase [Brachybacterium sp. p3-SID957]|uniref:low molecular weight protein-tyrosine-phosphatase n=1 Tax=Brachybacterium sp. p3-SID957 TaxID=2916049 RepID=UPI002882DBA3|nr:low molecular weight protein-tyrosine-phosphatase [Brachybacterium sp. p3-SID957]
MTYRILTVCTGNICRSPMAEYALVEAFEQAGLADQVEVASLATSGWEVGNPIDPRAAALLERHGITTTSHRARQMDPELLREADLILTLDHDHVEPVRRAGADIAAKQRMMREFDPQVGEDTGIRDPWYGDEQDFETAWEQITAATEGIVAHVRAQLENEPGEPGSAPGEGWAGAASEGRAGAASEGRTGGVAANRTGEAR